MKYRILIDRKNYTEYTDYTSLPFNTQETLDESLDVGHLVLSYTKKAEPFKPLTYVEIKVFGKGEKNFYFFVSNDTVTEIPNKKLYTHEISLIEQTKWLERFTGITKTFTTVLNKDYANTQRYGDVMFLDEQEGSNYHYERPLSDIPDYTRPTTTQALSNANGLSPQVTNVLFVESTFDFIEDMQLQQDIDNRLEFDKVCLYRDDNLVAETNELGIELRGEGYGKYSVQYKFHDKGLPTIKYTYSYTVGLVQNLADESKNYSIADVINDLLQTVECLNSSEKPRFKLFSFQEREFAKIQAPDFSLTGTLWECLSEVGKFIHAIPRLNNNTIYFDKLGKNKLTYVNLNNYCSSKRIQNVEQYVSELDSTVNNIVNVDNKEQGTLATPFKNGFRTVRADKGVVVLNDDNVLIQTEEPIEEIIKVECGYLSDGRYVGDITPYIFESAEYNTLSSFGGEFPTSRAYALYFTQGQKNIKGLNFKIPNAVSEIFNRPSIINIIARKLNVEPKTISANEILNLQFSVSYIPVISARIKQSKSCLKDLTKVSMLDFNQSSNKINSVAYGENMKGTVAKLGNPEIVKVYLFNDAFAIPNVGDLFNDDYYISVVKNEFYKDFFKCEIALSKDFNKLNDYVGINSQKRFYEISEKQAVERYVNYEDYCVIGETIFAGDGKSLISPLGIREVRDFFISTTTNTEVDACLVSRVEDGVKVDTPLTLPVNSLSVGNSLVFNVRVDDNFSAGETRVESYKTKMQYQTPYTDVLGRIDSLDIQFGKAGTKPNNYQRAVKSGNAFPKIDNNFTLNGSFYTDSSKYIVIKKDNREIINFTYQMNFITDDYSLIIGKGLAGKSNFITDKKETFKVYILQEKLGKFETKVNLENAVFVKGTDDTTCIESEKCVEIAGFKANASGKAIAIVNDAGELIIGKNIEVNVNDEIKPLYLTFTHKII